MMRIEEVKQKENVIKLICSMNSKNDFEKQKMVILHPKVHWKQSVLLYHHNGFCSIVYCRHP